MRVGLLGILQIGLAVRIAEDSAISLFSAPLQYSLTIKNKLEAMQKYLPDYVSLIDRDFMQLMAEPLETLIPEKLKELGVTASVKTLENQHRSRSRTAEMELDIHDVADLTAVFGAEQGQELHDALASLEGRLAAVGMEQMAGGVRGTVGNHIRRALLQWLPARMEKLLESGEIEATVAFHMAFSEDELPLETIFRSFRDSDPSGPMVSDEAVFWVSNVDREVFAKEAAARTSGPVRRSIASSSALHMSPDKLVAAVLEKLSLLPESLAAKLGSELKVGFRAEEDLDFQYSAEVSGFFLVVNLDHAEMAERLRRSRGDEFAAAFEELCTAFRRLHGFGVAHMANFVDTMQASVDADVGSVRANLLAAIREIAHADVRWVSREDFAFLKFLTRHDGFAGKCCRSEEAKQSWWVPGNLLVGGGAVGMGVFAHKGKCPNVYAGKDCYMPPYLARTEFRSGIYQTHHASASSCFPSMVLQSDEWRVLETYCPELMYIRT